MLRPLLKMTALTVIMSGTAALAEVPRVVADIPAVGSLVAQVMGDLGAPQVLLPAGGNAHSYQLRPSEAAALQDADLLVWVGPELTPWLDRAAASLGDGARLGLLALPGTHRQGYGETAAHDHAAEAAHEEHAEEAADHDDHAHEGEDHEGHDHGGHDHEGTDPHAWLDPQNGRAWLAAIAGALSARDPSNAAAYAANAEAAAQAIAAADAEAAVLLDPLRDRHFVVFHDAYGYFTGHYGLAAAIPVALGDAATPSAERLATIRKTIAAETVTCAFPETAHDPALVASVIEGTGARMGEPLDPSGSGHPGAPDLYQAILRDLAQTLANCLGQS